MYTIVLTMIRRHETSRSLLGQFKCARVHLGGASGKPFFLARLAKPEAQALLELLEELARREGRHWYFLTSSTPDPSRIRVVALLRTPDYEQAAQPNYLRGEIFRVTGKKDSCNINFSGPVGARLLAERLQSALSRADATLDIVIPNRHGKRDLVEFITDADREAMPSDEHERLGRTGTILAAKLLANEDFSDWE